MFPHMVSNKTNEATLIFNFTYRPVISIVKGAAIDMRYFARSKFFRS